MREKAVHDMKVRTTHLWEDRDVVREERENGTTQVAIQRTTQDTLIRALEREGGRRERERERSIEETTINFEMGGQGAGGRGWGNSASTLMASYLHQFEG